MATLKNPSIYDDRGTIGSADELDEYGIWVKIEPEELPDSGADSFPDFDADFGPELSPDETAEADTALGDFDFSGGGKNAGFDDVEALRQDIQSASPAVPANNAASEPAAAPTVASEDLSIQLLMKIADELSSIREEVSMLKGELAAIRSGKPPQNAASDNADNGGFFDEEDDGKIALTGDELDNIIHTADFTEETGDDADASQTDDFTAPDTESAATDLPVAPDPAEVNSGPVGEEILYDGLGRPLKRTISQDEDVGVSFDFNGSNDLEALRESGVDPMTAPPDDISYLEEDPLAEENLDLSYAVIDEPDLSEGVKDAPLEEPSLDNLPLIDLEGVENNGETTGGGKNDVEEKLFLDDSAFENLPDIETLDGSSSENTEEGKTIDLSIFDDDLPAENSGGSANAGDLSFELLDEDADLPVHEDVQDNVITDDSFESVSLDDEEIDEVMADDDLEQSLPGGMKIELEDLPPLDLSLPEFDGGVTEKTEPDDINFDLPGAADNADAGDQAASTAEVPPAIRMELKDVLVYMDKLLESLPEEKINEFAQSEHYNTYKKLFEELGIQQ
jgi:hypothetical protein